MTTTASKDVEKQEAPYIAGDDVKWCMTLEKSLSVSYKVKNKYTITFTNPTPRNPLKEIKTENTVRLVHIYQCL